MIHNPCFNEETKTDCICRRPGCSAYCPEWAKYVEERDRLYAIRADERRAAHDRAGVSRVGFTRYVKGKMADRARKNNN